jgi:hypothetical protein
MLNVVTVRASEGGAKLVHVNIQRMESILNMKRLIITDAIQLSEADQLTASRKPKRYLKFNSKFKTFSL